MSEEDRNRLLIQLEHDLIEPALLNDNIRNPLTVSFSLVEMNAPGIEESVACYIHEIDETINNPDTRWIESEKTIRFLPNHYRIGTS